MTHLLLSQSRVHLAAGPGETLCGAVLEDARELLSMRSTSGLARCANCQREWAQLRRRWNRIPNTERAAKRAERVMA